MIVWLASYPKSGNTFLRSLLGSYFFSNDGNFNFELLKYISQFPDPIYFKDLNINLDDNSEVAKNYINAQKLLNKNNNSIRFFKTHSSFCKINGHNFTDLENSLGVIYIVRDPRNVVISQSYHYDISIDESTELMINNKRSIGSGGGQTFVGAWNFNFNSWKQFDNNFLLIKYEDLVKNPEFIFLKIIKFLEKLLSTQYKIDNNKLKKVIETTQFEKLKNLEKKFGFTESIVAKNNKKKDFFNLGPKNDFSKLLDQSNRKKIESAFKIEMQELSYT
jgi:hypothetical protein